MKLGTALLAVAALVASLLTAASAAGQAGDGSVVFIHDDDADRDNGNVWIMPAGDPGAARPVTDTGNYEAVAQDDAGVIYAGQTGGGPVVRMDRSGTVLGQFEVASEAAEIRHFDVTPDGSLLAYTAYAFCTDGFGICAFSEVVRTDDGQPVGTLQDDAEAMSWYGDDQVVLSRPADGQAELFDPVTDTVEPWFRDCPDFEYCPSVDHPEITRDGRRLVSDGGVGFDENSEGITLIRTHLLSAPPPAVPTHECDLAAPGGTDGTLQVSGFSWSPDGTALVFNVQRLNSDFTIDELGVWQVSGFGSSSCEDLQATMEQVLPPGAYAPDWGPATADGGSPTDPTPDPTEPGPEPTDPTPDPTEPGPEPTDPTPDPTEPSGAFDGDPAATERINVSDPIAAALVISRSRFADDGAARVVLSRDDTFPDSLAGATLSFDGPLLLTPTALLHEGTRTEIERVLPPGGTVHLLGGTAAISQAVEDELRAAGFTVDRLAGESRVETAIMVANRVRSLAPEQPAVALARAFGTEGNDSAGWADSVTGGAWGAATGVPILVTDTASVHPAVAAWLDADQPSQTVLFGGTVALSEQVEAAVPNPLRVFGAERTGTAAAIATDLWGVSTTGMRRFAIIDGFQADGWAYGLAAAGMAADAGAPLLMVNGDLVPDPTAALVAGCHEVDLVLVGSGNVVRHQAAVELDALDESGC